MRETGWVSSEDEVVCTAIESDWGDDQPNILMHPSCECPRCAPQPSEPDGDESWLRLPGTQQRVKVEPADLGRIGRDLLG